MSSLTNVPKCIHDEGHHAHQTFNAAGHTTVYVCVSCGRTLYEAEYRVATDRTECYYYDEVYRTLYTRKGRLELLREVLEAHDWPVPQCWVKPDDV